jgi:leucyl aminopeptidase
VIKAEAQNVTRKLADTPANHMTPKIFAQVSLLFTSSYIGSYIVLNILPQEMVIFREIISSVSCQDTVT